MPASFDLEVKDRRSVLSINTKPSGGRLVAPYPIRNFPFLAAKVKKPGEREVVALWFWNSVGHASLHMGGKPDFPRPS
jgi:hypothetical protein